MDLNSYGFIIFLLFILTMCFVLHVLFKLFYGWYQTVAEPKDHFDASATISQTNQERSAKRDDWLNDETINTFMELIMERSCHEQALPKVFAFNTFFYEKLNRCGHDGVKRWTKKNNIFDYQLLLVPVHLGNHWCMAVIDFERNRVDYYDSMLGDNDQCLDDLREYLNEESLAKRKRPFDTSNWTFHSRKDIPHQKNFNDCGVFACMFAEYASRRVPITFSQSHIPYFRERMAYEISQKKLIALNN